MAADDAAAPLPTAAAAKPPPRGSGGVRAGVAAAAAGAATYATASLYLLSFDEWYAPLLGNLCVVPVLAGFDMAWCALAPGKKGRWFVVHSFANFISALACLRSVVGAALDPCRATDPAVFSDRSVFGDASPWPPFIITSTHAYHMLAFHDLTPADYFHHLLFVPILGGVGQFYHWGAGANVVAFFISGLPGAIDYAMLAMVKFGSLRKLQEKRLYSNISVWCRAPGLLWAAFLLYIGWLSARIAVPQGVLIPIMLLTAFNGMYYCKQAVANFAVHYLIDLLLQDPELAEQIRFRLSGKGATATKSPEMSFETGSIRVMWDLQTPQRGS